MPTRSQPADSAVPVRLLMLGLFLMLIGCGEEHGDPVVDFEDDDPEMSAAIAQARQTLGEFLAHLQQHPDDELNLIKAPIETGERVEHIWIDNVTFDGTQFTGTLSNQPYDLSIYKQGDEVTVPRDDVSDWMYVVDEKMHGGHTIAVMQRRMAE